MKLLGGMLMASTLACPAWAEVTCGRTGALVERLPPVFGEALRWIGIETELRALTLTFPDRGGRQFTVHDGAVSPPAPYRLKS